MQIQLGNQLIGTSYQILLEEEARRIFLKERGLTNDTYSFYTHF